MGNIKVLIEKMFSPTPQHPPTGMIITGVFGYVRKAEGLFFEDYKIPYYSTLSTI